LVYHARNNTGLWVYAGGMQRRVLVNSTKEHEAAEKYIVRSF